MLAARETSWPHQLDDQFVYQQGLPRHQQKCTVALIMIFALQLMSQTWAALLQVGGPCAVCLHEFIQLIYNFYPIWDSEETLKLGCKKEIRHYELIWKSGGFIFFSTDTCCTDIHCICCIPTDLKATHSSSASQLLHATLAKKNSKINQSQVKTILYVFTWLLTLRIKMSIFYSPSPV